MWPISIDWTQSAEPPNDTEAMIKGAHAMNDRIVKVMSSKTKSDLCGSSPRDGIFSQVSAATGSGFLVGLRLQAVLERVRPTGWK
mmetsp:Transcript_30135/g.61467  ORF Transcript_30135/g.61467 Transcript_30135/m.61467 type:complete len:85 (+) Transcript_30135:479-733(+)